MKAVRDSRRFREMLEAVLRLGLPARFRAEGSSMYPAIRNGDLLTVAPLGESAVRPGEVVVYRHGDSAIAHRVIRLQTPASGVELVLRGDAADACDRPVPPGDVLGRVVAIERHGRVRRRVPGRHWSAALRCALHAGRAAAVALAAVTGRT